MSKINHEYRHIHVHVPKTGGTSMLRQPFVGGQAHMAAKNFRRRHPVEFVNYFKWGFVRNPFDRAWAIYNAAIQHRPSFPKVECLAWNEYVPTLENGKYGLVRPHTLTMTHFLCDNDGNCLVDFVGRYENLAADWTEVCTRIGVEPTQLGHLNATKKAHWREVYTPELAAIVARVYADDFANFDYDPEDFGPRTPTTRPPDSEMRDGEIFSLRWKAMEAERTLAAIASRAGHAGLVDDPMNWTALADALPALQQLGAQLR